MIHRKVEIKWLLMVSALHRCKYSGYHTTLKQSFVHSAEHTMVTSDVKSEIKTKKKRKKFSLWFSGFDLIAGMEKMHRPEMNEILKQAISIRHTSI